MSSSSVVETLIICNIKQKRLELNVFCFVANVFIYERTRVNKDRETNNFRRNQTCTMKNRYFSDQYRVSFCSDSKTKILTRVSSTRFPIICVPHV